MPRNRWVFRVAVGLAAGFVLLVVAVFYSWQATRRAGVEHFQVVTARLEATDPRSQLDDVEADRGSLLDDQNSARLVPKFRAALVAKEFIPVRVCRPANGRSARTGSGSGTYS
jgi:hypothetical protein